MNSILRTIDSDAIVTPGSTVLLAHRARQRPLHITAVKVELVGDTAVKIVGSLGHEYDLVADYELLQVRRVALHARPTTPGTYTVCEPADCGGTVLAWATLNENGSWSTEVRADAILPSSRSRLVLEYGYDAEPTSTQVDIRALVEQLAGDLPDEEAAPLLDEAIAAGAFMMAAEA